MLHAPWFESGIIRWCATARGKSSSHIPDFGLIAPLPPTEPEAFAAIAAPELSEAADAFAISAVAPRICVRALRTPQSLTRFPRKKVKRGFPTPPSLLSIDTALVLSHFSGSFRVRDATKREKSMRKAYVFLLAAALLVFGQPARATVFGSVRGIVHDPQHRPFADAASAAKIGHFGLVSDNADQPQWRIFIPRRALRRLLRHVSRLRDSESPQTNHCHASDSSRSFISSLAISLREPDSVVTAQAPVGNVDSATPTTLLNREDIELTPGADRTNSLL